MADKQKSGVPTLWSSNMFDEFRKEMDQLFEGFFGDRGTAAARSGMPSLSMSGVVRPAIDIAENDAAITLTAELPGMSEDQVDLSVRDNALFLKGEKKVEHDSEKDDVHVFERSYGSFQRSFPLPDRVDADAISAEFDKGILVVTMPKKEEAKTAQRKIKVGG
ncbi:MULTISPECIES: Hsp20/alpha crystallin family protein [unclassified Roseitalea]|uniref:Hsp20/alpha crystallin family protein n=1 Tax=unclassified Roseitalea TaxID=2639107 RepID=UPI00274001A3|nr:MULTISPECIES: Hsp20/alpha crystallin family protein [unclassified Roseitalea]